MLGRRRAVQLLFAAAAAPLFARRAFASVAQAFSVEQIVAASDRIVVATPLDAISRWEAVGNRRRIVTYTRVRVDEALDGGGATEELLVRTLGGRVGKVGQIVHGEALLLVGRPAVLFLKVHGPAGLAVTGMAQGHFPLVASGGEMRLAPSPRLASLAGSPDPSAAKELVGKTLEQAGRLVRDTRSKR